MDMIETTDIVGLLRARKTTWQHAMAVMEAGADEIDRLRAVNADMLAALEQAADTIKDMDGGDPRMQDGWASDELLEAWLIVRTAIAKATSLEPLVK